MILKNIQDLWLGSDHHLGHERIIELANRPFDSVAEMNDALITWHNELVKPADTYIHLGDVALGKIAETLPMVDKLHGRKLLIPGNHDRCMISGHKYQQRWWDEYSKYFEIRPEFDTIKSNGKVIGLCHFPRYGDSHMQDRFEKQRPKTWDGLLLHGHVHDQWRVKGDQFNVGVDVNKFRPVSLDAVLTEMG